MAAQKQQSSLLFFMVLMFSMFILFDQNLRSAMGNAVGIVFFPLFGFGYRYPVLTVFLAGSVVIIVSTLIRHFTTDWIEMAKNQEIMSKFQKEYRKARLENNKYMIKKLEKLQPKIMQKQTEASSKQMKLMPVTMLIFIPVFTWIWDFLMGVDHYYFDVPWAMHVSLFDKSVIFANWILLYMLMSIPLTQVIQYLFKFISWSERKAKTNE